MSFGHKKGAEEMVVLTLSETDTTSTFFLNSFIVSNDAKDIALFDARNAKCAAVTDAHINADNFTMGFSQTLNPTQKSQNESVVPTLQSESGCQALAYEINEATGAGTSTGDDLLALEGEGEDPTGLTPQVRQFVTDTTNVALITPGCLLDPEDLSRPEVAKANEGKKKKKGGAGGASGLGTSSVGTGPGAESRVLGETAAPAVSLNGAGLGQSQSAADGGASRSNMNNSQTGAPASSQAAGGTDAGVAEEPESISEADSAAILFERRAERILASQSLLKRIQMMERAVQQNAFMRQQLDYRDLPDVKPLVILKNAPAQETQGLGGFGASRMTMNLGAGGSALGGLGDLGLSQGSVGSVDAGDEDEAPGSNLRGPNGEVKRLFSYLNNDLVQGRSVTCMVWNKVNQDLLAVGYGKLDSLSDPYKAGEALDEALLGGLVLFWSLRNPEYPEKVLRTASPVTALEFSKLSPMTLAVGCLSGDVLVYDVRREADWGKPIESSTGIAGGHSDPVWQVKWVPRGTERIETLVTVSSDGKVLQWTIKKGLMVSTLMRLAKTGQSDGWISRQAAGLSFDFSPDDPTSYVVGTEEGTLHRCSVSYTEQYLETYTPHHGPIYRVQFSPRWPELILTCSADWSMGLYHAGCRQALFSMRAAGDDVAVSDAAWCPDNSTIFAAVTQSGKLHIWDVSESVIDPVVSIDTTGDEVPPPTKGGKHKKPGEDEPLPEPGGTNKDAPPLVPFTLRRRGEEVKDEPKEGRVARLIKALSAGDSGENPRYDNYYFILQTLFRVFPSSSHMFSLPFSPTLTPTLTPTRRKLTCVKFSEHAPVIVVGDSKGAVTVYRVLTPPLITHMGPRQQYERLKAAVFGSVDPVSLARLREIDTKAASPSEHTAESQEEVPPLPAATAAVAATVMT